MIAFWLSNIFSVTYVQFILSNFLRTRFYYYLFYNYSVFFFLLSFVHLFNHFTASSSHIYYVWELFSFLFITVSIQSSILFFSFFLYLTKQNIVRIRFSFLTYMVIFQKFFPGFFPQTQRSSSNPILLLFPWQIFWWIPFFNFTSSNIYS